MAPRKKTAAKKTTTRTRTKREPIPMPASVREAGSAALAAFEGAFLENGEAEVGIDGSTTKMLKGDSGMQKTVKLSGDGGAFRATVRVSVREAKTRARKSRSRR